FGLSPSPPPDRTLLFLKANSRNRSLAVIPPGQDFDLQPEEITVDPGIKIRWNAHSVFLCRYDHGNTCLARILKKLCQLSLCEAVVIQEALVVTDFGSVTS